MKQLNNLKKLKKEKTKDIIKNTENKFLKKECRSIGNEKRWKRKCPSCNRIIVHINQRSWKKSILKNKQCKSCINKGKVHTFERILKMTKSKRHKDYNILYRFCPKCNEKIFYKHVRYRRTADKINRPCKKCFDKSRIKLYFRICPRCKKSIRCSSKYQKKSFEKRKSLCRKCLNKSKIGIPLSDKTKKKLRLIFINNAVKTGLFPHPSYNPEACKIIDEYGKQNGYKFQHALNGGEYYIKDLNYWLDGYDKEKNVVIEYDEPHHFNKNGSLKKKDIKRMNEIKEHLNCKFIRLKLSGEKYLDI